MINQTENQQVPKNVNLSIKPIALFFIREALLKLVEISILFEIFQIVKKTQITNSFFSTSVKKA